MLKKKIDIFIDKQKQNIINMCIMSNTIPKLWESKKGKGLAVGKEKANRSQIFACKIQKP